uniref:Uncharacterized protein n=1 Tax=Anguilla anguilla TaxID=7936 RepID=A0A0E9SEB6_ANGAN
MTEGGSLITINFPSQFYTYTKLLGKYRVTADFIII